MNLGALGGQLKKLGVTDDQVKKAEGLLGSNAALLGKAESALGGKKPAEETSAPAPGAGAVPPAAPALQTVPGPVDPPAAATATVAAAAVAGEAPKPATAAPVAPGLAADGPKNDAIHKFAAQAGISSSIVDQGLAALGKIPEPQLKAAAAKLGVSESIVNQGLGALGIHQKTAASTPVPATSTPASTPAAPTAGAAPPATVPTAAGLEQTHPVADSGVTAALPTPDSTGLPTVAPGGKTGPASSDVGPPPAAKPPADKTADSIAAKLPGGLGDSAAVKGAIGKGLSMFGK
ncbi:hypothetical protein KFL_000800050 [Klebsormidium nitens]|uniref:Uncharacterized protein n=1 Tax=Klebsormidium nitens TaxID=105231 RepID=A0A1Y1HY20_KLENI|nr:hypothetical protein KFL_000800050 [Klebsormidium nitens]|eukprot:GAQ81426.1 hypothetical protein KFL_000800050 [Klebsormidium nitens]